MKQRVYWFSLFTMLSAISVACEATPTVAPLLPAMVPPAQVTSIVTTQPLPTATTQPSAIVPLAEVTTLIATQTLPTPISGIVLSQPMAHLPSLPKRIAFPPGGTSATLQGALAPYGMDSYILRALAGQTMIVNVLSSRVPLLIQIVGTDGNPLKTFRVGSSNWSGTLPTTQDYLISIAAENGSGATYTLFVTIPPPPTLPPANGQARRITFPLGGTSATLQGNLMPNEIDRYVLRALGGQTMTVNAFSRQANLLLQISGEDGNPLKTFGAGSSNWSGVLSKTQDYVISIATENSGAAIYTLLVTIPPTSPPPDSPPKRIQFAPGTSSTLISGNLALNAIDVYVLRALAGQTLSVNVSSQAHMLLAINGADGTVLKSSGAGTSNWSGVLPRTQDYFLRISTEDGGPAAYTLRLSIPPLIP